MPMLFEPRYEKTVFCIYENKDADQLRSYSCAVTAQMTSAFFFRYIDTTIPLHSKSEIPSL